MDKKFELHFVAPTSPEDCLEIVTTMSLYLDFWASRSGEWHLLQLITKTIDQSMWDVVAKHVMTPSGLSLASVDFAQIGVAGMLQAMAVFCQGLMDLEIPQEYLRYCAGITSAGIISLIKDAQRVKSELSVLQDPTQMLATLFSRAIAGSL